MENLAHERPVLRPPRTYDTCKIRGNINKIVTLTRLANNQTGGTVSNLTGVGGGIISKLKKSRGGRKGSVAIAFAIIYAMLIIAMFESLALAERAINDAIVQGSLDNLSLGWSIAYSKVIKEDSTADVTTAQNAVATALWAANGGLAVCSTVTTPTVVTTASTVSASVTCTETVAGQTTSFSADNELQLQGANIEIAMVLDNTGSMAAAVSSGGVDTNSSSTSPSKLTGLKIAAYDFLNGLLPYATQAGQIKVSMVPMTTDINIGTSATAQGIVKFTYLSGTAATYDSEFLADPFSITSTTKFGRTTYNCTDSGYGAGPLTTADDLLAGTTYGSAMGNSTSVGCGSWSGPNQTGTYTAGTYSVSGAYTIPSTGVTASNWNGCVADRDQEVNASGNPVANSGSAGAYVPNSGATGNPSTNTSGIDYDISYDTTDNGVLLPVAGTLPSLYPADNINCGGTSLGPMQLVAPTDLYQCTGSGSSQTCAASIPQSMMNLLYCRTYGNDKYCASYSGTSPSLPSALTNYGGTTGNSNSGAMIANGDTDLTTGLAWGLNMLTPGFPLAPNASTSTTTASVDKFLIFFTDGYNTQDRFNYTDCQNVGTTPITSSNYSTYCSASGGYTSAQEFQFFQNMNTETSNICQLIQQVQLDPLDASNKITIFTVGTADADTTILNACPSDSTNAYTGLTSTQLDGALGDILGKISSIRFSE